MASQGPPGAYPLDMDDKSGTILASIWVLTGLSSVFIVLRAYCKIISRRGLWWDDYVMILAWVSS